MQSLSALIARLERSNGADRRLDSEVIMTALAPAGCVLDLVEGLDGWDIQYPPDPTGEPAYWREAADVLPVTAYLDAATELVIEARPSEATVIMARALQRLTMPDISLSGPEMVSRAARTIVAELLRAVAVKERDGIAQVA